VDYNARFIRVAQALAEREGLRCRFEVGNAFTLGTPATCYLSSGVLHHFRGTHLTDFFARQAVAGSFGFLHTDILPSALTPLGAWLYHRARMRQPLARHDGTLSAVRAHSGATLLAAARAGCPQFAVHIHNRGTTRLLNVFQTVIGVRPDLEMPLRRRQRDPARSDAVKRGAAQ